MNTSRQPDWTRSITDRLDESVRQMDAVTLARLNSVRRAALQRARCRPARALLWPAAGLLGGACVLFLAIGLRQGRSPVTGETGVAVHHEAPPTQTGNDSDGVDSIELYQDLDFYAWLGQQKPGSGG